MSLFLEVPYGESKGVARAKVNDPFDTLYVFILKFVVLTFGTCDFFLWNNETASLTSLSKLFGFGTIEFLLKKLVIRLFNDLLP